MVHTDGGNEVNSVVIEWDFLRRRLAPHLQIRTGFEHSFRHVAAYRRLEMHLAQPKHVALTATYIEPSDRARIDTHGVR